MFIKDGKFVFLEPVKEPKWLVTMEVADKNKLIFGPRLLPGWGCRNCKAYNNIERKRCKFGTCVVELNVTNVELTEFSNSVRAAGGRI